jgi:hypothetical protein
MSFEKPSMESLCSDPRGVKNDRTTGVGAWVGAGGTIYRVTFPQKFRPNGLEKFRCRVKHGTIDLVRLVRAALRQASVMRKRESSGKKANTGPSATAGIPFV